MANVNRLELTANTTLDDGQRKGPSERSLKFLYSQNGEWSCKTFRL